MDNLRGPNTKPIELCLSGPDFGTTVDRLAEYIHDPVAYLKHVLGEETFERRRSLLCLTEEKIERDIYGTGAHKQNFEQHVASLIGKQCGLFFITGVQAQLIALKIWSEQRGNNRVAWHQTSHLESFEGQAYKYVYGLQRVPLGKNAEENPTVEEIEAVLALPDNERPAAILLEIPNRVLGCKTYTFEELTSISKACREAGVKLHCDGARLWEIEPFYEAIAGVSFAEIGSLFDSVYVSLYKGIGGNSGAMLVCDSDDLIHEAKIWQRRVGGNLFTSAFQLVDCERGYNENIGAFAGRRQKMIDIVKKVMEATAEYTTKDGQPVVSFVPAEPTCCQILSQFQGYTSAQLLAARDEVQAKDNIVVFKRLRGKQTLDEKMAIKETAVVKPESSSEDVDSENRHLSEWVISGAMEALDTQVFADGYVALCKHLKKISQG